VGNGRGGAGPRLGVPDTRYILGVRVSGHALQPRNRRGWTFRRLYKKFLKLKAKPSGYPRWINRLEDEDRYVDLFWQSEGIRLDKGAIRYNAAKRGLAKLCLNTMLRKLTERNERTMTKIVKEPKELYGFRATLGVGDDEPRVCQR